ncbi:unnamed protein product [Echinostoma caproni]|uniref:DDE_3 domain-containing protein n=1 Tax=Echinostoma caproni TaxID=27848 RepID=A0A183AV58_9TREM|nr:unnamed protein product [Echinostoma caproni]
MIATVQTVIDGDAWMGCTVDKSNRDLIGINPHCPTSESRPQKGLMLDVPSQFGRSSETLVNQARIGSETAGWWAGASEIPMRRPRTQARGNLLHHDKAPAHSPHVVGDFLAEEDSQEVRHPPYSSNLAPYDLFVPSNIKRMLRGIRYEPPTATVKVFI